jgi:hypothetical protein
MQIETSGEPSRAGLLVAVRMIVMPIARRPFSALRATTRDVPTFDAIVASLGE